PVRGARLPTTIRQVPLVGRRDGTQEIYYNRLQWDNKTSDPRNVIPREDYEKAIAETPAGHCQLLADQLPSCQEELDRLTERREAKMGPAAPGLGGLRTAVQDCLTLLQQILKRKGPVAPQPAESAEAGSVSPAVTGAVTVDASRAATREEIYQQLARL